MRRVALFALLLVIAGCAPVPTPEPWPIDPDALMRPEAMFVAPAQARPREVVAITYAERWDRGILYAIEEEADGEWVRLHLMISDANGGRPTWFNPGDPDVAVAAVGVAGPGPDRVPIPDVLEPGTYRICTANAGDNICTPIEVVAE